MRYSLSQDPSTTLIGIMDDSFMLFYRHVRRNARRITNLVVALLPLMALLVGSCKTSQTPYLSDYVGNTSAEQFRTALFPDRINFHGDRYTPAAGYIAEARSFIEDAPQTMMMLSSDEIGYMFGKPSFHRRDADAEVWQYKTGACVVDFYFYGQEQLSQKQLSYVDVRLKDKTDASALAESGCLHSIKAQDFGSTRT